MDERYSLFLEMYELAKTMRTGFGNPLSTLYHKQDGYDLDLRKFEDIIFDNELAERANYPHGMRITHKGLNIKPHELRRIYLGLKPESELQNEELYREILIWMRDNGNSHIGPILNDIGIDPNKESAIENIMTGEGWIKSNKSNCILLPAGEAFLFGLYKPTSNVSRTVTNNILNVPGHGNIVSQGSTLDNVHNDPVVKEKNIMTTGGKSKSSFVEILSWIITIIAGLIGLYEFFLKKVF